MRTSQTPRTVVAKFLATRRAFRTLYPRGSRHSANAYALHRLFLAHDGAIAGRAYFLMTRENGRADRW